MVLCMLHNTWFQSYLSNCMQSVKYGGTLSKWGAVHVGVPQGSILGPLLFSIYINDLPTVVKYSQIHMYADDTLLHCCGTDLVVVQEQFQQDVDRVQGWMQSNRLQLNVAKSALMLIGSRQKIPIICIYFDWWQAISSCDKYKVSGCNY